jgi:hypothetical protein
VFSVVIPQEIKLLDPVIKMGVPGRQAPERILSGKYIFAINNIPGIPFGK